MGRTAPGVVPEEGVHDGEAPASEAFEGITGKVPRHLVQSD